MSVEAIEAFSTVELALNPIVVFCREAGPYEMLPTVTVPNTLPDCGHVTTAWTPDTLTGPTRPQALNCSVSVEFEVLYEAEPWTVAETKLPAVRLVGLRVAVTEEDEAVKSTTALEMVTWPLETWPTVTVPVTLPEPGQVTLADTPETFQEPTLPAA